MKYGQGINAQGMPFEEFVAGQMPAGTRLPPNFKTFDFYDPSTGSAVSVKTLDTMTPSRIVNPQQVYSSLKTSVDAAAGFTEYSLSGKNLNASDIQSREVQVAVPPTTNELQWAQIKRAVDYAATKGVTLNVKVVAGE
jgi:filamentous hemagglutinin